MKLSAIFAGLSAFVIGNLTKLRRRRRRQRQRERQKINRFNEQFNNPAHELRFIVNFFAVSAQLAREMTKF